MGEGFRREVDAGVFDGENGFVPRPAEGHPHLRPLRRMEGGVGEEVPHRLPQQPRVPFGAAPLLQFRPDPDFPLGEEFPAAGKALCYNGPEVGFPARPFPRFQFGDGQQLLHQRLHPAHHLQAPPQVLLPVGVDPDPVQHPGELAFDHRQRGLQFVGGG